MGIIVKLSTMLSFINAPITNSDVTLGLFSFMSVIQDVLKMILSDYCVFCMFFHFVFLPKVQSRSGEPMSAGLTVSVSE